MSTVVKLVGTFRYTQHEMNLMILALSFAEAYGRADLRPKYSALRHRMIEDFSKLPPDRNPMTKEEFENLREREMIQELAKVMR